MKQMKTIAVLGLGRFGTAVASCLAAYGHDVIAIDRNMQRVDSIKESVSYAVCADFTEFDQLKEIGLEDCDAAVIATGSHLEESLLALMNLKELNIPWVLAKAKNDRFQEILMKAGADEVVQPEKEMGERTARKLGSNVLVDLIELDERISVIELKCPRKWMKKTLKELNLRNQYGINVLGIRKSPYEKLSILPSADELLEQDDQLMVIADNQVIEKIESL